MSAAKKRIPIPQKTEAKVMFSSDRLCCVDRKRGVHIHHIDSDPSNNDFNNLVLLCFDCHDEATKTGSLSKKLQPQTILEYRTHHYNVISQARNSELVQITGKHTDPTYIDHLNIAIQANVLIEVLKIKSEYQASVEVDRTKILEKLFAYSDYCFPRVSAELFEFLITVSYEVRAGISLYALQTVNSLVFDYFPPRGEKSTKLQVEKVVKLAIQIAFGIIYDTSIYTSKFHSMKKGYEILQYVYNTAENMNNNNLKKEVNAILSEIHETLHRPDRDDLSLAISMFEIYNNQIQENPGIQAKISGDLEKKVWSEKMQ